MADEPKTYTQDEVNALIAENEKGLKKNRDEALTEAKHLKARLATYDGIDVDEVKTLKAEREKRERDKATAEGDFKSLEKQLVDRHQGELQGRDAKIGKLTKALEKRLKDADLTAALVTADAKPGMLPLLLLEGSRYVAIQETESDFVSQIVEDGKPMYSDGQMTPMTTALLVEKVLKQKYPDAFNGSGSSGGGASRSNAGGGGPRSLPADQAYFQKNLEDLANGKAKMMVATE